ncbi:MAG: UDP-3-O-acyl-N-acetylglucosamine deacetylase [Candidatus Caldatribacteriaceae bacterium]
MKGLAWQRTICQPVVVEGEGLHGGKESRVVLYPAEVNQGIIFRLNRWGRETFIPARVSHAVLGCRSSVLQNDGVTLSTVEHFLGACWGIGVDNLEVVVEGEELPGGDGSALHWWDAFSKAGIQEQDVPRRVFILRRPFHVENGVGHLFAFPAGDLTLTYVLDCTERGEFLQSFTFKEEDSFEAVCSARTFAFTWERDDIERQGLGMGVRESAVLFEPSGVGNRSLRSPYEACAHKILDLLGDLMLLGVRIQGGFLGLRSGHALNQKMVRLLWEEIVNAY